ncbi:MAG TPA: hypothetical protein G4O11_07410 [Anaerolineae bacterium]|nr:hypothetical protein [Anaerolineae bacterium]
MIRKDSSADRVVSWWHRAGLNGPAAFLLEAVGPLLPLGAQVAFLLEPLFGRVENPFSDLAQLLEDPSQLSVLMENLRAEGER